MRFLEHFRSREPEQETVKGLHPNFSRSQDKFWYYNREYSPFVDRHVTHKVIFKFEDPRLLDDFPFLGKIGLNKEDGPKYFGVAYGDSRNKEQLVEWAKKFPWAQLLIGLDDAGVMTDKTKFVDIAPQPQETGETQS